MKKILVLTAVMSALAFGYSHAGGDGKDKAKKGKKECSAAEKKECSKKEGKKSCCASKSEGTKTEEVKPAN